MRDFWAMVGVLSVHTVLPFEGRTWLKISI